MVDSEYVGVDYDTPISADTIYQLVNSSNQWAHPLYLVGANLCGVLLRDASLRGGDFSGCRMRGADLRGVDLEAA